MEDISPKAPGRIISIRYIFVFTIGPEYRPDILYVCVIIIWNWKISVQVQMFIELELSGFIIAVTMGNVVNTVWHLYKFWIYSCSCIEMCFANSFQIISKFPNMVSRFSRIIKNSEYLCKKISPQKINKIQ